MGLIGMLALSLSMLWPEPDMSVVIQPPNAVLQQGLYDRLQQQMWGTPKSPNACRDSLFNHCNYWVQDT